ncbi:MAG: MlaD family protein [Gemmatimonadota bacterium]|nr:MlaD family protein [Gemmatimonadota bacterium]
MDLHYKQEVTVGLLVVVALVVLVGGLAFLSGKSIFGTGTVTFGVRMENVAGLVEGDPVQISGVRVGRVAGIDLRGVGDVVVFLDVGRGVRPRVDARVFIRPLDAFGAMYVDYFPGQSEEQLAAGQVIQGSRDQPLTELAAGMAAEAGTVLTGVNAILSQRTADDIHETLVATQRAMNVVAQLGSGPLARDASRTLAALASAASRLDSTLGSPDLARSVAQLDEITESLNEMVVGLGSATQALARIMEKMESDSGSFGRLVNDTSMYVEVVKLTSSMRLLLDDMRERPHRYFNLSVF